MGNSKTEASLKNDKVTPEQVKAEIDNLNALNWNLIKRLFIQLRMDEGPVDFINQDLFKRTTDEGLNIATLWNIGIQMKKTAFNREVSEIRSRLENLSAQMAPELTSPESE